MKNLIAFVVLFSSLKALANPQRVASPFKEVPAKTIVINEKERALYFILGTEAIRYRVAVPKGGKEWSGSAHIAGKYSWPAWSPPVDVRRDHPELPDVIPGGAANNPMGAAALTLDRDQFAIHGTTRAMRSSIGTAASYGCIRMLNEDVIDLYQRVDIGTVVLMRR